MTITIELPAGTEEKLRAHALATGKNVEALVVEAVEAKLSLAKISFREILAPVHEDFRKSGLTDLELAGLLQEARNDVGSNP